MVSWLSITKYKVAGWEKEGEQVGIIKREIAQARVLSAKTNRTRDQDQRHIGYGPELILQYIHIICILACTMLWTAIF